MSVAHIMSKPVYKNLGYDIERDFAPITVVSEVSNVFAAHPSLPAKNVKELIALAKAKPGELTYATSGVGSPEHFAGELFKMMTKTNLLPVPYKGGGPIAIDLMAGHVITSFSTMPPIIPHIRAGRVKALAVTKDKRAAVLPDVPTIAETGSRLRDEHVVRRGRAGEGAARDRREVEPGNVEGAGGAGRQGSVSPRSARIIVATSPEETAANLPDRHREVHQGRQGPRISGRLSVTRSMARSRPSRRK
jgi:hypothetical protein